MGRQGQGRLTASDELTRAGPFFGGWLERPLEPRVLRNRASARKKGSITPQAKVLPAPTPKRLRVVGCAFAVGLRTAEGANQCCPSPTMRLVP
jgi:hypothetical protein